MHGRVHKRCCDAMKLILWIIGDVPGAVEDKMFSWVGVGRILISTAIAAAIGYFVWWLQSRSTRKRVEAGKITAARLADDLRIAEEEKTRLAAAQRQLLDRVSDTEKLLGVVRQQLSMLEEKATPLIEAAKIRLIAALTHPHPEFAVPDALLKLTLGPEGYITPELASLLKERETSTHPDVTPVEKLAAAILPKVVELAALEAKVVGPLSKQLVSSPAAKPNETP